MDERPEDRLVEEARRGGREAFAELVRRHERRVYGVVFRMGGNRSDAHDPGPAGVLGELRGRMDEALESLPAPFRASFVLVAGEGLSHADAARVLGCSENTVSWRMHKARKLLQARVKPFLGEVRS